MPPIIKKQTPVMVPTAGRKITPNRTPTSKPASVLDRITGIGFDENDGIKLMLYGLSGSGKTTLWGSFPGKTLALVCSGGDKPGELRSLDTPENRDRIKQVVIRHSSEVREIADHVKATGTWDNLVLDHCTGFQDLVLAEILGLAEVPAQKSWGLATQQQYGQVALQCKDLFRSLLGCSCNVIMIAQERVFKDEGDSELITPTVGAGLSPSIAGWLNTAVDYLGQTFKRQRTEVKTTTIAGKPVTTNMAVAGVDYCLRVGPHSVYQTKFRVPKGSRDMPEVIVDPDYAKLMALIRGA